MMKLWIICCIFLATAACVSSANKEKSVPEWTVKLKERFGLKEHEFAVIVDVSEQALFLAKDGEVIKEYPVSTSTFGTGNRNGSWKTPLGMHAVYRKIGDGAAIGTVFKGGSETGAVARIYLDNTNVSRDLITTRILWLEGLEPGVNRGEGIDSWNRRIYIHGTHEEGLVGTPASHGCVRMKNRDVVDLFDRIPEDTLVEIRE